MSTDEPVLPNRVPHGLDHQLVDHEENRAHCVAKKHQEDHILCEFEEQERELSEVVELEAPLVAMDVVE